MSCQVFRPIADVLWAGVLFPVWCCSGRPPCGDPGRCAQSGRCSLDHLGPECLALSGAEGLQGGAAIQLRDGGHALGGEHAAALQLPVLVLLQQHRPHQAGDRGVVGENAHHGGSALYFFIHPLEQVGSPVFFSSGAVGSCGRQARRPWPHAMASGQIRLQCRGLGVALRQRGGQIVPARLDRSSGFLSKYAAQAGGDHTLASLLLCRSLAARGRTATGCGQSGRDGNHQAHLSVQRCQTLP